MDTPIEAYETISGGISGLFMMLCQNNNPACVDLITESLEKIAELMGPTTQPKLHLYPALLALYSGGVGAVLGQAYKILEALLYVVKVKSEQNDEAAIALTTWSIMDRKCQGLLRREYTGFFPLSYRLCEVLREYARQYLFLEGDKYETCFDKFEYFHNLAYSDLFGPFYFKLPSSGPLWGTLSLGAIKLIS